METKPYPIDSASRVSNPKLFGFLDTVSRLADIPEELQNYLIRNTFRSSNRQLIERALNFGYDRGIITGRTFHACTDILQAVSIDAGRSAGLPGRTNNLEKKNEVRDFLDNLKRGVAPETLVNNFLRGKNGRGIEALLSEVLPVLKIAVEQNELPSEIFAAVLTVFLARKIIQQDDVPMRIGSKCFAVENGEVLFGLRAAGVVMAHCGSKLKKILPKEVEPK